MKKIGILGLTIVTLLLTGCSKEKKLTCVKTFEDPGASQTDTVTLTFKKDKIALFHLEEVVTFEKQTEADEYYRLVFDRIDQVQDFDAIQIGFDKIGKVITIETNADYGKLAEDTTVPKTEIKKKDSYSKIKTLYMNEGFECE